jgi:hypothetical protein
MSVDWQRPCITEGSTLHNHRCENLKSYTVNLVVILYLQINTRRTHSGTSGSPPTTYRGRKHGAKYDMLITIHREEAKQCNRSSFQ